MFEDMVEHSERYLYEFFRHIEPKDKENIGLMGGWAAYLLLAKRRIDHIGSRDIDIFFNPNRITFEELVDRIEGSGFMPHSTFRWSKFVQISTGSELTEKESSRLPLHDVATIFLDVASPAKMGSEVMHSPVLAEVFEGDSEFCGFKDLEILTPSTRVMIEMKLHSTIEREDAFKRAKDIADLFALLNYDDSLWKFDEEGRRISTKGISGRARKEFKQSIDRLVAEGSVGQAANMLKLDEELIIQLLEKM